jgi:hypothetical protein
LSALLAKISLCKVHFYIIRIQKNETLSSFHPNVRWNYGYIYEGVLLHLFDTNTYMYIYTIHNNANEGINYSNGMLVEVQKPYIHTPCQDSNHRY